MNDPKMSPQHCEECGTELEVDIDYEGKQVDTCPKCDDVVTIWSVGHNMPGYSPMADEPTLCATFDEARDALLAEMDFHGDFLAEADADAEPECLAWNRNLIDARADLANATGPEWGMIVDDSASGTSYWIVQIEVNASEVNDE